MSERLRTRAMDRITLGIMYARIVSFLAYATVAGEVSRYTRRWRRGAR